MRQEDGERLEGIKGGKRRERKIRGKDEVEEGEINRIRGKEKRMRKRERKGRT